jgi:hypothetical protein
MEEETKNRNSHVGSSADPRIEQIAEHAKQPVLDVGGDSWVKSEWFAGIASFILLLAGLAMDFLIKPDWFSDHVRLIWYGAAYCPLDFL